MNFLLRNNLTSAQQLQPVKETHVETNYVSRAATTLGGLISEDSFAGSTPSETRNGEGDEFGDENDRTAVSSEKNGFQVDSHIDVTEDAGFIIIPFNEIPDNWSEAPDVLSFRSLDRYFVFPGEEIGILACLSAYKQDTEIITPFKVAAVMNKNGIGESSKKQNGNIEGETSPGSQSVSAGSGDEDNHHGEHIMKGNTDSLKDVSAGESLLRMEDHRRQTEQLLQRFKNSHFFVRVAESDEPLWSKRRAQETFLQSSTTFKEQLTEETSETQTTRMKNSLSASIDIGHFDARTSGGLARGAVKCGSLSNGDIVVLLHVNIGVQFVKDPVLEILQFEKYEKTKLALENQDIPTALNQDPYAELLKWLLPLENSVPSAARPLSPPTLSTSSSVRSTSSKPTVTGSSGSQLFSFGHFRSYSLPPNMSPPPAVVTPSTTKPTFDPDDWNQFSFKKFVESGKSGKEGLLSFRGVPLLQERFSVRCGLEGIFTPGRRWRRKIELIQPVEIHSVSVDCNSDDVLCVHVKNVSPAHVGDIVVYIDAITIIFEEAAKGGPPLFLPIACIESGNGYSLPNLALRRGEEHSFILKPTTMWRHSKGQNDSDPRPSRLPAGNASSNWKNLSNIESKHGGSPADQYAILVSCRCNDTESKLFFKQRTNWRPRISRDLMISVASEMSTQTFGSDGTKLPVQVLTLQASNMTPDNLTLTVLAPASFTSPSVVPLSGSPTAPLSPFSPSAGLIERLNIDMQGQKVEDGTVSERPNSDLGCTHLWLQSRVPLGCIPSQSTATVKLEVLPLTDGIITLDSLQIEVTEKGLTYIPEQSLKINSTSSIATSIL